MDEPGRREWMYNRVAPGRREFTDVFMKGVDEFLEYACTLPTYTSDGKIRCPCAKCKNKRIDILDVVKTHIYKHGFLPDYFHWTSHGEPLPTSPEAVNSSPNDQPMFSEDYDRQYNQYETMVMDVAGPSFEPNLDEPPNADAKAFYDMLAAAQAPLYEGCEDMSELESNILSLSLKVDSGMAEQYYNQMMHWVGRCLPKDHRLSSDLYSSKKMVAKLGLGYEKIDCCVNGCMLYYKNDANETQCKFCGCARFKVRRSDSRGSRQVAYKQLWFLPLIPRLQRLFTSSVTAKEMRWHYENRREPGFYLIHLMVRHGKCLIKLIRALQMIHEMCGLDFALMGLLHMDNQEKFTLVGL